MDATLQYEKSFISQKFYIFVLPLFSKKGLLNSLILFILRHKGPSHGYALSQCLEEKFGWKTSQTSIYNTLKDMESNNLVSCEEQIKNGRNQKIYSISDTGLQFMRKTKNQQKHEFKKTISKLLVLTQQYGENEFDVESNMLEDLMLKLRQINDHSLTLMSNAPIETQEILLGTINSLEELANQNDIKLS
ncbi:hypothetical protein NEF87_001786 [Candidatus Lokiarchaeum ossiferum]|uniref:Transcription regulator PadR N-terminal domain-containing protein n=1 Tax=Candidatus Lokiarchaeum ossiferum TaxID=2951803 RepID=A0ABY6HPZ5_9ARCH|nr:hypothetical protein NEF87_001786 [Candidatus Lokiarchaeum sp. B-35]